MTEVKLKYDKEIKADNCFNIKINKKEGVFEWQNQ
jgi:hypothetical protein